MATKVPDVVLQLFSTFSNSIGTSYNPLTISRRCIAFLQGRGEYFGQEFSHYGMGDHSESFRPLWPTGAEICQVPSWSTERFRRSSRTKTAIFRLLLGLETWNFHCDLPWHRGSYPEILAKIFTPEHKTETSSTYVIFVNPLMSLKYNYGISLSVGTFCKLFFIDPTHSQFTWLSSSIVSFCEL